MIRVPVAPVQTIAMLEELADDVVCPATPEPFGAIGLRYRDFHRVNDEGVIALLQRAWASNRGTQEDYHGGLHEP